MNYMYIDTERALISVYFARFTKVVKAYHWVGSILSFDIGWVYKHTKCKFLYVIYVDVDILYYCK